MSVARRMRRRAFCGRATARPCFARGPCRIARFCVRPAAWCAHRPDADTEACSYDSCPPLPSLLPYGCRFQQGYATASPCLQANWLKSEGVKKGDCVTIYLPMVRRALPAAWVCVRRVNASRAPA